MSKVPRFVAAIEHAKHKHKAKRATYIKDIRRWTVDGSPDTFQLQARRSAAVRKMPEAWCDATDVIAYTDTAVLWLRRKPADEKIVAKKRSKTVKANKDQGQVTQEGRRGKRSRREA